MQRTRIYQNMAISNPTTINKQHERQQWYKIPFTFVIHSPFMKNKFVIVCFTPGNCLVFCWLLREIWVRIITRKYLIKHSTWTHRNKAFKTPLCYWSVRTVKNGVFVLLFVVETMTGKLYDAKPICFIGYLSNNYFNSHIPQNH